MSGFINLLNSKNYKISKFIDIKSHLQPGYSNYDVQIFTIEISTLGFIGDISSFRKVSKFTKIKKNILMKSVLNDSYQIYRMRNTEARIYSRSLGLPLRKGSLLRFIDVPYRLRRPLNLPKEVFF